MTIDEFNPQCKITPEMFWQFRRKQLGGKSAVTGAELPTTLAECPPAVQADHYAQACYAMAHYVLANDVRTLTTLLLSDVPIPSGVTEDAAIKIRRESIEQTLVDHGAA